VRIAASSSRLAEFVSSRTTFSFSGTTRLQRNRISHRNFIALAGVRFGKTSGKGNVAQLYFKKTSAPTFSNGHFRAGPAGSITNSSAREELTSGEFLKTEGQEGQEVIGRRYIAFHKR